jgi:glycyl-tRNA synthetase beta subunit
MVEDEKIRNNRLVLLDGIGQLFLRIADFSKLT